MLTRRIISAIAFALTLFASTENKEVDAPVQSLDDRGARAVVGALQPFLCDSLRADDCFMMFASEHPPENLTTIPFTQSISSGASPYQPVACSFTLPYHGDRCALTGPSGH